MENTGITLSAAMNTRLATGHDSALETFPNWDLPTLAGAGALRSTANDLLIFLEMALGIRETPLASAFAAMLVSQRPTGIGDNKIGLGWGIMKSGDNQLIWHNGGTGGYCSFIGFLPEMNVGVAALVNASTDVGIDDIAQHLLNPEARLSFPDISLSQGRSASD